MASFCIQEKKVTKIYHTALIFYLESSDDHVTTYSFLKYMLQLIKVDELNFLEHVTASTLIPSPIILLRNTEESTGQVVLPLVLLHLTKMSAQGPLVVVFVL